MVERQIKAYEPDFDREAYLEVKGKDTERLKAYTKRQLETHLGERFNVLLSKFRYEIKNGQIYGQDMEEPFMNILLRGRNYRRLHGNPVDFAREDAEVAGFAKIEQTLLSKDASLGTMMLSVSPPGKEDSVYKHNFYDIFTLKEDEKSRYIEARRYSCGLSIEETAAKLREAGLNFPAVSTAEDFLANPIEIAPGSRFMTPDDVHKYLHKEHKFVEKEKFDEALRMAGFLIASYVNSLARNPFDEYDHNLHLNAALNGMDTAMAFISGKNNNYSADSYRIVMLLSAKENIYFLGTKPVRQVDTGCGISGGFGLNGKELIKSAFSVSEFGFLKDDYGSRVFKCPSCGKENIRPKNQLLKNCQHCNSAEVAC